MSIILASASPRRSELMKLAGFNDFKVCPANVDEFLPAGISPQEAVCSLAGRKAEKAAAEARSGDVVIAADTLVYLDSTPLGKPRDRQDAVSMLTALSGRTHFVYSGLCVIFTGEGQTECCFEKTAVHFRELSQEEILRYVASGEPLDKAGAYAAQGHGAVFVKGIEGDFFNVMGLPVFRLYQILTGRGIFPSFTLEDQSNEAKSRKT